MFSPTSLGTRGACVVALATLCAASAAGAPEKPQPLSEDERAAIVRTAPQMPQLPGLDLKLRLVDYIDCTNPRDPHGFMDQGTSRVVTGPAGRYRVTASHRHAFFAYRFRAAGKDNPVLLVFEYPDDADRNICFFTHESGLSGAANIDWSLETGVYTGDPLPLSNRMQYHTFIFWPQDEWPVAIVANWSRYGANGAASRIWVYAITEPLPALDINAPDPERQRVFGHYNSFHFLPTNLHFGLRSPNAIQHMLDYCRYVGINELSWQVVTNNSWGFACRIPSWEGGDRNDHLDQVLAAMDARGGFGLMAGFAFDGSFRMGGKRVSEMAPAELLAALNRGMDEFLERYGRFRSLKGILLGAQYGIDFLDLLNQAGIARDVVAHIKAKRPDLQVITFVGGRQLHQEYFSGEAGVPSAWEVTARWEESGRPWSEFLGDQAAAAWKAWGHDPAKLREIDGLTLSEQLQPDDHRIFPLYAQQPRSAIYYDLDRSQRRSDAVATNRANLWNTHFEGWFGLMPDYNFWYRKLWVAPDFTAPPPLSLAPFANALGLRDRLAIVPGSWNNKCFGHEADMRRFTRAFLSLPPVPMQDVSGVPVDTVRVRWSAYQGKRYVSVLSLIPFASEVALDGRRVALAPYELVALSDGGAGAPRVSAAPCAEYRRWVEGRIALFEKLCAEVKALDPAAVPPAYTNAAAEARRLLAGGKLYAADIALGVGLVNEMRLRKEILSPPEVRVPRLGTAPPLDGNLDAWPKEAADIPVAGGEFLAGHLYFPNSWSGPGDLSARLRLGHYGERLYLGIDIRDDVLTDKDECAIRWSAAAYRDWRGESQKWDLSFTIPVPVEKEETSGTTGGFTYRCRRTSTGYRVEGSVPLAELGVAPGPKGIGFLLFVTDDDGSPNLFRAAWARKQVLLYPHRPVGPYWSDARGCGRLVLAP
ncbi:MAG: hypothetical protein QHJ73_00580 [Armatimonadota bacterium]|nr:hypothetical protein [Armatimonadota bacterium]